MKKVFIIALLCAPFILSAQSQDDKNLTITNKGECKSDTYLAFSIQAGADYLVNKIRPTIDAKLELGFKSGDRLQLKSPTIFSLSESEDGTEVAVDQGVDLMYFPADEKVGFGFGYVYSKESSVFDSEANTWKIMFSRSLNDFVTLQADYYIEGKKSIPSLGLKIDF